MKKLLSLVFILSFALTVNAQRAVTNKKLVADETWFTPSGKGSFRIITCNDSITKKLMVNLSQYATKITQVIKEDRHGKYWERSFYFTNEHYDKVILFINKMYK